ncbi:V-type proton ATPase subunit G [Holothuria leucospilota]|uniref:V-type proton ATPase subunit G n=1 Tax=Holothuria leucospilota TaxID=206669 RepID=A0A9Q1C5I4_HOLLE|nr:V-type proton ATPase subunit G [Holothuria leucospilota]
MLKNPLPVIILAHATTQRANTSCSIIGQARALRHTASSCDYVIHYVTCNMTLSSFNMAAQTPGIQQLLQAEKKAAERVADARKRKARRLKQAKEEAQEEIEQYRKERERQFQEIQQKYLGSKDDQVRAIDEQTKQKIKEMDARVKSNKEEVLKQLFDLVFEIKPELHQNFKVPVA